ncbi:MAG TPA: hypothetical protein VIG57_01490 [Candidatus Entotheonella sp.]
MANTMSTTSVTSGPLLLIKRTDVASTHLIIVGQGRQAGRHVMVPAGKTIHHYIEDSHDIDINLGTFGLAMRGKLQARETYTAGERMADYLLTSAADDAPRTASARHPDAQWHRYVEQSDKSLGAVAPLDANYLGQGVPCDILRLRRHTATTWSQNRVPRFSQLLHDELLAQYDHVHCLFSRAKRRGPTEVAQAPQVMT